MNINVSMEVIWYDAPMSERRQEMKLEDALQETGCAISIDKECITSVERLPDEQFLLMTRRGVSILQCMFVQMEYLSKRYMTEEWYPARIAFGSAR